MSVDYEEGRRLLADFRAGRNQEGLVLFLLHYAEALLSPLSAAPDGKEVKRLREALKLGKIVMDILDEHGPSIVPHLLDTDENAGQRFRAALKETGHE